MNYVGIDHHRQIIFLFVRHGEFPLRTINLPS